MTSRALVTTCVLALAAAICGAEEPTMPSARDMLKARLAEEAKQKPAQPSVPAAPPLTPSAKAAAGQPESNAIVAVGAPATETQPKDTKTKREPATVLPKVEVRKGRITVLDQQLAKQEQDIAREKKNTKPSEVDQVLNDSKIAKPLSIFGGESAQFRKRVASERVALMEDEKDLIEAIAHAKTKQEKAELQKQLDALRAQRRELEKALR